MIAERPTVVRRRIRQREGLKALVVSAIEDMGTVLKGAGTTLKRPAHGIDSPSIGNKTRGYERESNDAPYPTLNGRLGCH